MARSETDSSKSRAWAWPVGILIGLAVGIPSFGAKGGVAFGVAMGLAFAIALGATRSRVDDNPTKMDEPDDETAGSPTDGPRRA